MAAGRSSTRADLLHAQRRAARGRLDHQRQAEPGDDQVQDGAGAELAERAVRQRHPVRRRDPGGADDGLGGRLVPGQPAGRRRRADVGHAGQVEDRAQGAVLARGAVQGDEHRVGRRGRQAGQQLGVGVAQLGVHARRGSAPPTTWRARGEADLALEGQPAGQDDGAQRVRLACRCRLPVRAAGSLMRGRPRSGRCWPARRSCSTSGPAAPVDRAEGAGVDARRRWSAGPARPR